MKDYTSLIKTFCPRLKAVREAAGIDKKTVAEKLGYGVSNYSSYESKALPSIERLAQLAEFYGVSTDYLLGLSDQRRAEA